MPTPAMLAGDWTQFAACTGVNLNRGGFVNNRIDPSSYAAPALDVVRRIGLTPNNPCGEVFFGTRSVSDEHQYVGRADYQMSQEHTLFGRVVLNTYNAPHGGDANPNESILAHNANGYDNLQDAYGFGSTYVLNSTTVNQFRVSVNRIDSSLTSSPGFTFCDIGVRMTCIQPQSYIEITGAFTLGTRLPQGNFWRATTWSISDDVTHARGAATSGRSASRRSRDGSTGLSAFFGIGWNVFRGNSTGSPMGDFLTGQVNQFNQAGNPNDHRPQQTTLGLYAADSWVVSPRVTLNYGLRWDPGLPQALSNERVYSFDYERFQQGIRSTVYPNAPPGCPTRATRVSSARRVWKPSWWRFAPRVGLAWDVNGDGRSSLRTSYGRSYEVLAGLFKEDWGNAAPWGNLTVLQSVPMAAPWSTPQTPGGDPLPLKTGAAAQFNAGSAYLTNPTDMDMPVHGYLERQLPAAVRPELDGVGELPGHLYQEHLGPGHDQSRRLRPRRRQRQRRLFPERRRGAGHRGAGRAVLDDGQHQAPAAVPSGAAPGRRDLRCGQHDRQGLRHGLQRPGPHAPAARRQLRRRRQLHLVEVPRRLCGHQFRGSRHR